MFVLFIPKNVTAELSEVSSLHCKRTQGLQIHRTLVSLHCPKAEKAKVVCITSRCSWGARAEGGACSGPCSPGLSRGGTLPPALLPAEGPPGAGLPSSTPGVPRHPPDSPRPQTHSISFCYPTGSFHVAKHAGGWGGLLTSPSIWGFWTDRIAATEQTLQEHEEGHPHGDGLIDSRAPKYLLIQESLLHMSLSPL